MRNQSKRDYDIELNMTLQYFQINNRGIILWRLLNNVVIMVHRDISLSDHWTIFPCFILAVIILIAPVYIASFIKLSQ